MLCVDKQMSNYTAEIHIFEYSTFRGQYPKITSIDTRFFWTFSCKRLWKLVTLGYHSLEWLHNWDICHFI